MDATAGGLQKPVSWTLPRAMTPCSKMNVIPSERCKLNEIVQSGSKLNAKDTEYLKNAPHTSVFKHLGSATASSGNLMVEVNLRVRPFVYSRPRHGCGFASRRRSLSRGVAVAWPGVVHGIPQTDTSAEFSATQPVP